MNYQASVIIVSYNNFDLTTGPCLKSLLSCSDHRKFQIIVVDNASSDDTPCKLQKFADRNPNINLILNKENRGFSGGNNDGVKKATGENIILLNSDTLVPPKSLSKLNVFLTKNYKWGMVGPVTNNAGNEQKIFVNSDNTKDILSEGQIWCNHAQGSFFFSERLDFFCVAMQKGVYERLEGLDESFGIGYFEDTDFSIRAKKANIKMVVIEDVFIYHAAKGSFSYFDKNCVKRMRRANKRKLNKKHDGKIILYHLRERNTWVMKKYIAIKHNLERNNGSALDYRFKNRLDLAKTQYPNNPLKKVIYYLNLKLITAKFYK